MASRKSIKSLLLTGNTPLKTSGFNLNFIHTYKSSFNNRSRYYKYFDETYFLRKRFNLIRKHGMNLI